MVKQIICSISSKTGILTMQLIRTLAHPLFRVI